MLIEIYQDRNSIDKLCSSSAQLCPSWSRSCYDLRQVTPISWSVMTGLWSVVDVLLYWGPLTVLATTSQVSMLARDL